MACYPLLCACPALEAARNAAFYMPVGTIGRLFMAVESQAFEMAA